MINMATVTAGVVGGLIATIIMTIVMSALGDGGPPPTAQLVAKFTGGGDPEAYAMQGMALHFLYGIGAGVVFAVGLPLLGMDFSSAGVAIGLGLLYGIVLMIGGMAFWMRTVLGMDPDRTMLRTFVVAHLSYGLVLGGFLATGIVA